MIKEQTCIDGIFDINRFNKNNDQMDDYNLLTIISTNHEVLDTELEVNIFRDKEKEKGLIIYLIERYDYLVYSFHPKFKIFIDFFCIKRDIDYRLM